MQNLEWQFERLADADDHAFGRTGAAGFEKGQMPSRNAGIEGGQIQLA
ncbi:hypothetical protein N8E89_06940 [Phyllobacterium sp. A18/5-2]|nr:hypothetical protein [Phyllobacterium sp. A18/5-2]UXN65386.1 hypothetical protein N8E89_06940 [Phyllobacterium sp. A18/5-2]